MKQVGLRTWIKNRRAVPSLPGTAPTQQIAAQLEYELEIARGLAAILADRAKRAEERAGIQHTEGNGVQQSE